MPRVTAYRCPKTQEFFATREEYARYSCDRYWKRRYDERIASIRRALDEKMDELRGCGSFTEICKWMEDNSHVIMENYLANEEFRYGTPKGKLTKSQQKRREFVRKTKITNFEISDIHYGYQTTYWARPLRLGRPLRRDNNNPSGAEKLLGWSGRISFVIRKPEGAGYHDSASGSDILNNTGLFSGTGGSRGTNGYAYELTMFECDWESLVIMQKMKNRL
jgi:hypothetical protein